MEVEEGAGAVWRVVVEVEVTLRLEAEVGTSTDTPAAVAAAVAVAVIVGRMTQRQQGPRELPSLVKEVAPQEQVRLPAPAPPMPPWAMRIGERLFPTATQTSCDAVAVW